VRYKIEQTAGGVIIYFSDWKVYEYFICANTAGVTRLPSMTAG